MQQIKTTVRSCLIKSSLNVAVESFPGNFWRERHRAAASGTTAGWVVDSRPWLARVFARVGGARRRQFEGRNDARLEMV